MIPGDAWHSFIEDCNFTLATSSISSPQEKSGSIRNSINNLSKTRINLNFKEFPNACFPQMDTIFSFTQFLLEIWMQQFHDRAKDWKKLKKHFY